MDKSSQQLNSNNLNDIDSQRKNWTFQLSEIDEKLSRRNNLSVDEVNGLRQLRGICLREIEKYSDRYDRASRSARMSRSFNPGTTSKPGTIYR